MLTLTWEPSEPERVASYLVQASNAPLKGKNAVQGDVITERSNTRYSDDDTPFYADVTINLVDGKTSKTWSEGSSSWSCLLIRVRTYR